VWKLYNSNLDKNFKMRKYQPKFIIFSPSIF